MGTGFSKKKKQAKLFQEQLTKMQEQIQHSEVTGSSGNGLVTIVLSGEQDIKSIKIKPECVDKDDIEGLEDLIKAAYNDAAQKLKAQAAPQLPSGMGLPDLSKFGF